MFPQGGYGCCGCIPYNPCCGYGGNGIGIIWIIIVIAILFFIFFGCHRSHHIC